MLFRIGLMSNTFSAAHVARLRLYEKGHDAVIGCGDYLARAQDSDGYRRMMSSTLWILISKQVRIPRPGVSCVNQKDSRASERPIDCRVEDTFFVNSRGRAVHHAIQAKLFTCKARDSYADWWTSGVFKKR